MDKLNQFLNKIITTNEKDAKRFFVFFYLVGTIGFLIPYTADLFTYITTFALLITLTVLLRFHTEKIDKKTLIVFSIIFFIGYTIELIGVKTGLIFGNYSYSYGLGPKLFDIPLMIGINWLILAYSFSTISNKISHNIVIQPVLAAIGMTTYDLIIEQVAGILEMWHWENNSIPIQNYIAWFAVALVMQYILRFAKINTKNPLALVIILCHITFFVILYIIK